MLVPNPSEWKLEPLDQYAVYLPGDPKRGDLVINGNAPLVRNQARNTDWSAVKRQMMAGDPKATKYQCNCLKCVKERFAKMGV
jgi:hypothetical protein